MSFLEFVFLLATLHTSWLVSRVGSQKWPIWKWAWRICFLNQSFWWEHWKNQWRWLDWTRPAFFSFLHFSTQSPVFSAFHSSPPFLWNTSKTIHPALSRTSNTSLLYPKPISSTFAQSLASTSLTSNFQCSATAKQLPRILLWLYWILPHHSRLLDL